MNDEVIYLREAIQRAIDQMWRYSYEYPHEEDGLFEDIVTRILNEGLNYDAR